MKTTRAQAVLNAFFKTADAHEIDPNTMESKPPSNKPKLSTHWHPEEEGPTGCSSCPGGKRCEGPANHGGDHWQGVKKWTD